MGVVALHHSSWSVGECAESRETRDDASEARVHVDTDMRTDNNGDDQNKKTTKVIVTMTTMTVHPSCLVYGSF